jgi:hypothetical protein
MAKMPKNVADACIKHRNKSIKVEQVNIDFKKEIVVSGKSEPQSGALYFIGRTRSGNFSYTLTNEIGESFKFYSKKELEGELLHEATFGQYVTPDGTKMLFLND